MAKNAIIIGAGLGGMATAIRLSRRGWKVRVLEKNVRVGGMLGCASDSGFLWDVGPAIITMPYVLRDLFESGGHDLSDYLELVPLDPICRFFMPDGTIFNEWSNPHLFKIEIARLERDHGESLEAFMRYAKGIYEVVNEAYLKGAIHQKFSLGLLKRLHHLPKVYSRKTLAEILSRFFKNPKVHRFFMNFAADFGSSPYKAPSLLSVIPFLELLDGGFYIRGGIYRLAEAMEKCARDLGVEFLVDAEVTEIVVKSNGRFSKLQTRGVLLRSGLHFEGDAVICNADYSHAWLRLLQKQGLKQRPRSLENRVLSCASFMMLWGVRHRYPQLTHHNVFFSPDGVKEFDEIFHKKQPPAEPTIYLGISARTDPTQAPQDQDNYFVHVNVPALEPDHHWEQLREPYRNAILDRLEKKGMTGLRQNIVCERVITPSDFAARLNAYRGAAFGRAFHSLGNVFQRPPNRSHAVRGLYFAGGSVHPGGGIPFALLSAKAAVEAVSADFADQGG